MQARLRNIEQDSLRPIRNAISRFALWIIGLLPPPPLPESRGRPRISLRHSIEDLRRGEYHPRGSPLTHESTTPGGGQEHRTLQPNNPECFCCVSCTLLQPQPNNPEYFCCVFCTLLRPRQCRVQPINRCIYCNDSVEDHNNNDEWKWCQYNDHKEKRDSNGNEHKTYNLCRAEREGIQRRNQMSNTQRRRSIQIAAASPTEQELLDETELELIDETDQELIDETTQELGDKIVRALRSLANDSE
ncbi:hypothetical protein EJ08DRAFT_665431 [Tothia fuscella]|uniref:Uncharacterized protein n=1 Tax=Tothia fuscella TaxID=1048955 RepID=A0A9P4NH11_9PEZI|nr:hypothetical protein EJ08DRAFT_665431 [Tothia fuscella]